MQKYLDLCLPALMLGLFLFISSCDNDDDEPQEYLLSFSETSLSGKESDAVIEVEIRLDQPAPEDITVKYSLAGTAFDDVTADAEEEYADYEIDGDYEEVEIKEGESSAIITIVPYSDDFYEDDETIEITITEVEEENIQFDSNETAVVDFLQEDGMVVLLTWPEATVDGLADMDIIVWIAENNGSPDWLGPLTGSVYRGYEYDYEYVFIPKTFVGDYFDLGYSNTIYGLTYTYYEGTLDPLEFTSTFIEFANGELEGEDQDQAFSQSYTLDNLNPWSSEYPSIIAQTFVNNGGTFSDISEITKAETSSRVGSASSSTSVNGRIHKHVKSKAKQHELPEKISHRLARLIK